MVSSDVTVAGIPCGTFATITTRKPLIKMLTASWPWRRPTPIAKNTTPIVIASAAMKYTKRLISRSIVVSRVSVLVESDAIEPTMVRSPVATTKPTTVPSRHSEPLKASAWLSASATDVSSASAVSSMGSASPVSAEHSTLALVAESTRRSAGTLSPPRTNTTSPTTSSTTGTSCCSPSRITVVRCGSMFKKAPIAASLSRCCLNEMAAVISTTAKSTPPSTRFT
mmetsp:Transcript_44504/g.112136  ORF Transcript_44504/g.112136 Transcript_44504/m.112136 type:complete len:225 (-) Transcript_44504:470-1144(-)